MFKVYLKSDFPRFRTEIGEILRSFAAEASLLLWEEHFQNEEASISQLSGEDALLICLRCEDPSGAFVSYQSAKNKTESYREIPQSKDPIEQKRFEIRALKRAVFDALKPCFNTSTPWGCLTGIRPSKLSREMMAQDGEDLARTKLAEDFLVSSEKIDLVVNIVKKQAEILESGHEKDFDLYIGIPFCPTRCLYCSFTSYPIANNKAGKEQVQNYLRALKSEIHDNLANAKELGYKIRSVYVGGGTPTALTCEELRDLLSFVIETSGGFGLEFCVEAGRPDSLDEEKLRMLKSLGVTRLSLNPQTMNADTLKRIGRSHSPEELIHSFHLARKIGFDYINMDLIIGLPGENLTDVADTLDEIRELDPENLTVHTLAIKRSSRLKEQLDSTPLPDSDEVKKMLDLCADFACEMSLEPYYMYRQKYMSGNMENVGYAKAGYESIYNIDIMEETTHILALGAGSISKWILGNGRLERVINPKDLHTYLHKIEFQNLERKKLMQTANRKN